MTKNYLKQIFRNITKDIYQSSLNIIGLTLGFAALIFIATYISHESSFDAFHSKADRIYRVVAHFKMGDTEEILSNSENPIAIAAKNELPEVEEAVRLYYNNNQILKAGETKIIEERLWYCDKNVFNVFDFDFLEGDRKTALKEPQSIVVTKAFGEKYLGKVPLIGKIIEVGSEGTPYTITGVLKEIPRNSHLQFEALASYNSLSASQRIGADDWGNFNDLYTYLLIQPGTDFKSFETKFKELPVKHYGKLMQKYMNMSLSEFESQGNFAHHYLQPLSEIHLNKTYVDEVIQHGNKQLLYILGAIGILIIVVACFNFINVATARASLRAKDIGMKKVLGSSKTSIVLQVLTETLVQALLALFFAIILLFIVSPLLSSLSGLSLSISDFINLPVLVTMILLPFIISVLAGLFPAYVLSKFKPVEVMKHNTIYGGSYSMVRNVLVSMQFVVFIVLIASTIVIGKQLFFMRNSNPGFNKENVLVIENCNKLKSSSEMFKNELKKYPEVTDACYTSDVPSKFEAASNPFKKTNDARWVFLNRIYVDGDFLNTLKVKLEDGRFFAGNINEERSNAIINRKAAELFGWTDCSSDNIIYDTNDGGQSFRVVGIVEDFHMGSMKLEKLPLIILVVENARYLAIRVQAEKADKVIELAKNQWENINATTPFNYFFLDNAFNAQYKTEERLSKLVSLFSIVSAFIACLGLLGLVSFAALRRKKEIGVRKVNGAKVSEILAMLNKDFVIWVAVAFLVAIPVSYYIMTKWLENFAYKTELSWWIFALAGVLALGIALLTVSWQSWRAATRNPVEALRYE